MEFFVEEMVTKKKSPLQVLAVIGLSLVCFVLGFVAFMVLMPMFPQLGSIIFLVLVLAFYLSYRLSVSFNIEYEYSMINSEIDVDKIINQKSRKRLTTVEVKKLEAFGRTNGNHEYNKFLADVSVKKYFACRDKKEDNYFVVYNQAGVKSMLIFAPNDKMVEMIEKLNPRRW